MAVGNSSGGSRANDPTNSPEQPITYPRRKLALPSLIPYMRRWFGVREEAIGELVPTVRRLRAHTGGCNQVTRVDGACWAPSREWKFTRASRWKWETETASVPTAALCFPFSRS